MGLVKCFDTTQEVDTLYILKKVDDQNGLGTVYDIFRTSEKESYYKVLIAWLAFRFGRSASKLYKIKFAGDPLETYQHIQKRSTNEVNDKGFPIYSASSIQTFISKKEIILKEAFYLKQDYTTSEELLKDLQVIEEKIQALMNDLNQNKIDSSLDLLGLECVPLDSDFVNDVMSAALAGGIDYWAVLKDVDESGIQGEVPQYLCDKLFAGGVFHLIDSEDDYDKPKEVWHFGMEEFTKGLMLYLNRVGHNLSPTVDTAYVDAEHADVIVQLGLFGEIIYG